MKRILLLLLPLMVIWSCRQEPVEQNLTPVAWESPDDTYGQLFVAVQTGQVFPDSKTFVDCTPKFSPQDILKNYEAQKDQTDFDLKAFVLQHFELPRQYATNFQSDTSRTAAEHINALWPFLTRQPDDDSKGTLIPLPYSYIVPGGRFGEIYYWDSYFTMLGLQADGEIAMIENMANNFAYLIDTIGHIPNGNRTYYLSRSQPPFFSLIVRLLAEQNGSEVWKTYLPQLEKEYAFWMDGLESLSRANPTHRRVVRLQDGTVLNRYWDDRTVPRPEAYKEDVATAKESGRDEQVVYRHLRAAAESGWDFSSRWFADGKNLSTIHTTDIIPVDLNSLLYHLELAIAEAYEAIDDTENSNLYAQRASDRLNALQRYCWDELSGTFRDYDFVKQQITPVTSLAMSYPLFFNMARPGQADSVAQVLESDFMKAGGVVTTNNATGQQWDAPNGWAPLQWITIQGLRNYNKAKLAATIAERWQELNVRVYENTGKMVEKYNVLDMSLEAGGGEYPVQDGFGWTNGVLLRLLAEWKDRKPGY